MQIFSGGPAGSGEGSTKCAGVRDGEELANQMGQEQRQAQCRDEGDSRTRRTETQSGGNDSQQECVRVPSTAQVTWEWTMTLGTGVSEWQAPVNSPSCST